MQDAQVIDADGHVRDRDVEIRAFMDEPYCKRQGDAGGTGQVGQQSLRNTRWA